MDADPAGGAVYAALANGGITTCAPPGADRHRGSQDGEMTWSSPARARDPRHGARSRPERTWSWWYAGAEGRGGRAARHGRMRAGSPGSSRVAGKTGTAQVVQPQAHRGPRGGRDPRSATATTPGSRPSRRWRRSRDRGGGAGGARRVSGGTDRGAHRPVTCWQALLRDAPPSARPSARPRRWQRHPPRWKPPSRSRRRGPRWRRRRTTMLGIDRRRGPELRLDCSWA